LASSLSLGEALLSSLRFGADQQPVRAVASSNNGISLFMASPPEWRKPGWQGRSDRRLVDSASLRPTQWRRDPDPFACRAGAPRWSAQAGCRASLLFVGGTIRRLSFP